MAAKKTVSKKKVAKKAVAKTTATAKKAATAKETTRKVVAKKSATKKVTSKKKAVDSGAPSELLSYGNIKAYKPKKDEEYMNEAQKKHFKEVLGAWKSELMEEVDSTVHHMQDDAANFPDPNDRATQEEEFSLELRTRDRERKLIKKIDKSISAIDDDEYGYCESCGIEIGIRRLEARPTATLCIDCKTLDEIREKQRN